MSATLPPRRRKKKLPIWIWLVAILFLLVVGGAAFVFMTANRDTRLAVTTEKAERRTITSIVSATGKVQPTIEVKISSEVAGEIIELPVKDGQRVNKGDLLVRVNPETYEAIVRQRRAALDSARSSSAQAKALLEQAELDFRRLQSLSANQFVSAAELDNARTTFNTRRASFEASEFQIKLQETLLEEAQENLDRTTILAPMTGIITALNSELGERVVGTGQFAGTEIMRIADLDNMEVRVEVNENDVVNVAVGNKAKITVDAFPSRRFDGEVYEIANSARTTSAGTQEQVTIFIVKVRFLGQDVNFRPGMSATAEIETATVADALSVPLGAVTVRDRNAGRRGPGAGGPGGPGAGERRGGGGGAPGEVSQAQREPTVAERREARERQQRVVFVLRDGKVVQTNVETGIADNNYMEIKSGLEVGDEVVSGPYSALARQLEDGKAVRKREARAEGGPAGDRPERGSP